jgi:hypothetical protein
MKIYSLIFLTATERYFYCAMHMFAHIGMKIRVRLFLMQEKNVDRNFYFLFLILFVGVVFFFQSKKRARHFTTLGC